MTEHKSDCAKHGDNEHDVTPWKACDCGEEMAPAFGTLLNQMRDKRHRFRDMPGGAPLLYAYEVDNWADDLEAAIRTQIRAHEQDDEWVCEAHPELAWPHGNCPGPGCPKSAQVRLLVLQRRDLQQSVRALEGMVASGAARIVELEKR